MRSMWIAGLALMALFLTLGVHAKDPLMTDLLKKAAEDEKKELKERAKRYGIKEVEGTRIIGISREYYIVSGKQVYCDTVEFRCVDGRCQMVAKR